MNFRSLSNDASTTRVWIWCVKCGKALFLSAITTPNRCAKTLG